MKLKPYKKTKPSGVEWLGDVPVSWSSRRFGYLFRFYSGGTPSTSESELWDGDLPWVSSKDMKSMVISDTEDHIAEDAVRQSATCKLPAGSLLMVNRSGILKHSIPAAVITREMAINQDIRGCVPVRGVDSKFIAYVIRGNQPALLALWRQQGATVESLTFESVKTTNLHLPDYTEQRSIAAFLDRETGRIDALVAKKRELIQRLKEKRTALISRTVTRGLPPAAAKAAGLPVNPKMKDSGIEWLGEIPERWEVKKIKYVAKMESGHTPSRSEPSNWVEDECVIPWVSLNDTKHLKDNDYIGETAVRISEEGMKNSSAHLLPAGVVVFTRDATIGLTAITTCPAAVSQHIIAWVPGPKVTPKYLLLTFKVMQQYLDSFTFGSTLKTIGMTDVRKLVAPVPPLPEQTAIAAYLDTETTKLDALVAKVNEAVERLQEYRTALITAAVTGKIDVSRQGEKP